MVESGEFLDAGDHPYIALPFLLLLAAALVAGSAGAQGYPPGGTYPTSPVGDSLKPPSISITKATAARGVVTLRVRIANFKMYPASIGERPNQPDGGHWHVFVDRKYHNASANATVGKTMKLKPGSHRIFVELANNDHSLLKPRVLSKPITVRVR